MCLLSLNAVKMVIDHISKEIFAAVFKSGKSARSQQVDYSEAPNFTTAKTLFNIIGTDGAVEYPANVRYKAPRLKRNGKNH